MIFRPAGPLCCGRNRALHISNPNDGRRLPLVALNRRTGALFSGGSYNHRVLEMVDWRASFGISRKNSSAGNWVRQSFREPAECSFPARKAGQLPIRSNMKKLLSIVSTSVLLAFGSAAFAAETAPKSVIHVVTVSWNADTKPAQIQAAMDGVKGLPAAFKGIVRVWTKPIKVQGDRGFAFAMEFADEQALKDYTGSAAQKKWYEAYLPIRQESTTFDITN